MLPELLFTTPWLRSDAFSPTKPLFASVAPQTTAAAAAVAVVSSSSLAKMSLSHTAAEYMLSDALLPDPGGSRAEGLRLELPSDRLLKFVTVGLPLFLVSLAFAREFSAGESPRGSSGRRPSRLRGGAAWKIPGLGTVLSQGYLWIGFNGFSGAGKAPGNSRAEPQERRRIDAPRQQLAPSTSGSFPRRRRRRVAALGTAQRVALTSG